MWLLASSIDKRRHVKKLLIQTVRYKQDEFKKRGKDSKRDCWRDRQAV